MMKVQIEETGDELILAVAGRVAGAFVPELESCWRSARAKQPGGGIAVDLKNVTCVDRDGRRLLQLMHEDGVRFRRAGMATQDILEQLKEQPECTH